MSIWRKRNKGFIARVHFAGCSCRLSFSMIFVDIILSVFHLYSCGFHRSFSESFIGLISVCLNGTDYFPDCSGSSSTIWSFLSEL